MRRGSALRVERLTKTDVPQTPAVLGIEEIRGSDNLRWLVRLADPELSALHAKLPDQVKRNQLCDCVGLVKRTLPVTLVYLCWPERRDVCLDRHGYLNQRNGDGQSLPSASRM
jgi:hypothetical protein